MGNRAVITTNVNIGKKNEIFGVYMTEDGVELQNRKDKLGIYLHWNGGYDSVHAFLTYCKAKQYCEPTDDEAYSLARLVQVISNFFGSGLSIGIDTMNNLDCDNYDNGVYIIGTDWEIVDRQYFNGCEQENYKLRDMLIKINESQPEKLTIEEIDEACKKEMEKNTQKKCIEDVLEDESLKDVPFDDRGDYNE